MPDGLGSAAARIAEKAGFMRPVLEFFRESPRLLRQYAADDGARGGRQLERTMENVRRVIDRYGITMNRGAKIRIDKGIRGVRGVTMPDRMIRLSPQAFENEEQLARTIYHENWHVGQINAHGRYFKDAAEADRWEQEAWDAERRWWQSHPLNTGGKGAT